MATGRSAGGRRGATVEPSGPNWTIVLIGVAFAAIMALGVGVVLVDRRDDPGAAGDDGAGRPTECPPEEGSVQPVRSFSEAPGPCLEDGVDYAAVLTTELGEITIDLLEDEAPGTVNNFVVLARYGFYDGSTFHRVIPGFVVQGGDPVGDPPGSGGPGYTIEDELPEAGAYEVGSVAMANRYNPATGEGRDTGGSQFFIVSGPDGTTLPPDYPLFGEVTEGLDVVAEIEARGTPSGVPEEEVELSEVEILEREPAAEGDGGGADPDDTDTDTDEGTDTDPGTEAEPAP